MFDLLFWMFSDLVQVDDDLVFGDVCYKCAMSPSAMSKPSPLE